MLGAFGRRLSVTAALQPGEQVLDVGCGNGALSCDAALGQAGWTGDRPRSVGADVGTRTAAGRAVQAATETLDALAPFATPEGVVMSGVTCVVTAGKT